ncbi:MAG: aldose 1-epimerase family protein [Antricoccus sp.]
MTMCPSGQQYRISSGAQHATVVQVGGGIREYYLGDRQVLQPYDEHAMADGAHGAVLIPWPNRLEDGKYHWDGHDHQLALSEPDKHNATHGLLRWSPWKLVDGASDRVTLGAEIFAQSGYPFQLAVTITYALSESGLAVTTTAANTGDAALPYAHGQHPYLSPGSGLVDGCTLQLDAATRLLADPERLLPVGTESVADTDFDFRQGRDLSGLVVDSPFTDLGRDADGLAWVRLTGHDGRMASIWADRSFNYLQIFTGDTLATDRRRTGVAAEPTTAPPNALHTGTDVIRIEPGASITTVWGACLSD